MGWLQLRLVATRDRVELFEDALLAAGALAVTLGDHRDAPILEPGVGETPLWPEVDLTALFDTWLFTPGKPSVPVQPGLRQAEAPGQPGREPFVRLLEAGGRPFSHRVRIGCGHPPA